MEETFTLTVTPQELDRRGFIRQANLEEGKKVLAELYGEIWMAACYDPDNDDHRKYAKKLLPLIQKANDLLNFKR
jgi:hypothetical protein